MLHAFVTFYTTKEDEKCKKAIDLLEMSHKKYSVTPTLEWKKVGMNLGLGGPVVGGIETIDM